MAAKRLVPLLGGSAAVWTTCLVFFQVALLLGYLCAHWLATRLRQRAQSLIYTALLVACLAQAWHVLHADLHASTEHPVVSVFLVLGTLIGLPFVVLSATNPLLQAWYAGSFSGSSGRAPGELVPPYRLFALSNFGSLLALVIYPWLVEPKLTLRVQSAAWLAGFAVFAAAGIAIVWLKQNGGRRSGNEKQDPQHRGKEETEDWKEAGGTIRAAGARAKANPNHQEAEGYEKRQLESSQRNHASGDTRVDAATAPLSNRDRALWLFLAAGGSVLLCAMTNHLTQNIAAIPLLWVVPLTMYLLSFVIAFSRGQWMPRLLRLEIPVVGVTVARMIMLGLTAVALAALGYMLDDTRMDMPLKVSIPFYSAALLILCLFCHAELHRHRPAPNHATAFYLLIAAGGALGSIFVGIMAPMIFRGSYELACGLVLTAVLALAVTWRQGIGWRLFWSAASIALVVLSVMQVREDGRHAIARVRNFYGALRVTEEMQPPFTGYTRTLYHGTIQHGTEIFTDKLRKTPTSYYAHDSGVGLALDECCGERPRRVGVIGLGTGTLAAYGRTGDVFRFYDINPLVEPIARHLFTYLNESGATIEIVPGDARVSMAQEPPQRYDVLVIDAFSSDAIPVHLITSQAVDLYRRHLQPGGIIAFHVSNHFLDLAPIVDQLAQHAGMLAVYIVSEDNDDTGEYSSDWVLVTSNREFLARPEVADGTDSIPPRAGLRLWTDDYSSVLPILRWKEKKQEQ
jgi:spermidine synthase